MVAAEQLKLFDLERPMGHRGVLRVYVVPRDKSSGSVGIEQCAQVSQRILALSVIEDLLPGKSILEVSSPGINRRLRRPEHFTDAVGERVKVKFVDDDQKRRVVKGLLTEFSDSKLGVVENGLQESLSIPFEAVVEAHVDFLFK